MQISFNKVEYLNNDDIIIVKNNFLALPIVLLHQLKYSSLLVCYLFNKRIYF